MLKAVRKLPPAASRLRAAMSSDATSNFTVSGFCDPKFSKVRAAFAANFGQHNQAAASVAVMHNGKLVVDLYGNTTQAPQPFKEHSLVNVFSAAKGLASLCAHVLVDEGKLDLDKPVQRYWPEFEPADVLVRHLLTHQSGKPAIREQLPEEAAYNWSKMTGILAKEKPFWKPGTAHGYHTLTYSWLIGEVVRRVSGLSVGQFLAQRIMPVLQPGAASDEIDFLLGFGPEHDKRCVNILPPSYQPLAAKDAKSAPASPAAPAAAPAAGLAGKETKAAAPPPLPPLFKAMMDKTSLTYLSFTNPNLTRADIVNSRVWKAAELSASNGYANARGLARMYGLLANGGSLNGKQLLSRAAVERASQEQVNGMDQVLLGGTRFALGFMMPNSIRPYAPPHVFGHPGSGGSLGFADLQNNVSFGFTPAQLVVGFGADPRWVPLVKAVYESIGKPWAGPPLPSSL